MHIFADFGVGLIKDAGCEPPPPNGLRFAILPFSSARLTDCCRLHRFLSDNQVKNSFVGAKSLDDMPAMSLLCAPSNRQTCAEPRISIHQSVISALLPQRFAS